MLYFLEENRIKQQFKPYQYRLFIKTFDCGRSSVSHNPCLNTFAHRRHPTHHVIHVAGFLPTARTDKQSELKAQ